jgi:hypothetical protein
MSQANKPISDDDRALAAGYVLGDLDVEEQERFEQLLRQKPELKRELRALQASLRVLPQGLELVEPPPHLADQILTSHTLATAQPRRRIPWMLLLAGLSASLALLLGLDNLRLRQQLSIAQRQTPEPIAEILQRPNSRLVAIRSANPQGTAGTLLFTPGKWQEVVVSLGNLPPLPPDQVYRMWLNLANGDILPCGAFKPDAAGRVFVRINPPETPPKGVKATGVFVTIDHTTAPLVPKGEKVLSGTI